METLKEVLNEALDTVPVEATLPTMIEELDMLRNQLLNEKYMRLNAEYVLVTEEMARTKSELDSNTSMLSAKYKIDVKKDKIDPKTRAITRAK